jgi:hypothetical protein
MAKVKHVKYEHDGKVIREQFWYWCAGCGYEHAFSVREKGGNHSFNNDLDNPTVSPSLLQNWPGVKVCHSFIKNGQIQYLTDCQHELAGKTIELPDVDAKLAERDNK